MCQDRATLLCLDYQEKADLTALDVLTEQPVAELRLEVKLV